MSFGSVVPRVVRICCALAFCLVSSAVICAICCCSSILSWLTSALSASSSCIWVARFFRSSSCCAAAFCFSFSCLSCISRIFVSCCCLSFRSVSIFRSRAMSSNRARSCAVGVVGLGCGWASPRISGAGPSNAFCTSEIMSSMSDALCWMFSGHVLVAAAFPMSCPTLFCVSASTFRISCSLFCMSLGAVSCLTCVARCRA